MVNLAFVFRRQFREAHLSETCYLSIAQGTVRNAQMNYDRIPVLMKFTYVSLELREGSQGYQDTFGKNIKL